MLGHSIVSVKVRKTAAVMKMQVSFSDDCRKVSGSLLSVLQGKDSLEKSDWCFVSTDGEFRDFQPVCFCDSAVSLLEKRHIQSNNRESSGFVALLVSYIGF